MAFRRFAPTLMMAITPLQADTPALRYAERDASATLLMIATR